MPVWSIVLLTILVILLVVFIALIIVGNKLRKSRSHSRSRLTLQNRLCQCL